MRMIKNFFIAGLLCCGQFFGLCAYDIASHWDGSEVKFLACVVMMLGFFIMASDVAGWRVR